MQYPSMGKNRQYRVTIPQLNGGVNYALPPHLIEDNQLSDVKNMWYKDGRLQTRPGLVNVSDCTVGGNIIRTIKTQDKICVVSVSNNSDLIFSLFDFNGKHQTCVERSLDGKEKNTNVFVFENAGVGDEDTDVYAFLISDDTKMKTLGVKSNGGINETLKLYIPTLCKGGEPSEENKYGINKDILFEPVNLLTDSFKCDYVTNGKGIYFSLPKQGLPKLVGNEKIKVTHISGGKTYTHELTKENTSDGSVYTETTEQEDGKLVFSVKTGIFHFTKSGTPYAPKLTQTGMNVSFEFTRESNENAEKICNMKFSTWYGGGSSGLSGGTRLFVAGNPDEPNVIRWSALNNPLYFPENNYAYVGSNASKITAFGKQNELLVIFKENELYCSYYVQGNTPTAEQLKNQEVIDIEAAQAMFPVYPLHPEIGCDCPDTICLCNNRLVWFNSNRKVYGLFTTGQYNERNVRELSYAIEKKLKEASAGDVANPAAAEIEGNYLLYLGNNVFAMDYSTSGFSYYSSYSSDEKAQKAVAWYLWELYQIPKILASVSCGDKNILIAQKDNNYHTFAFLPDSKIGEFDENETHISSMVKTKLFDFGYPERLKRINPFYLQVSGADGEKIKLTYFRGNGKVLDDYAPTLTGNGLEEADPIRITPNANRVREFGIELDSSGSMEVGSLTLNYSMMGTVR